MINAKSLSDAELIAKSFELNSIMENYNSKKNDPRWKKRFPNEDPPINPSFIQLQKNVADEIAKRKLNNG